MHIGRNKKVLDEGDDRMNGTRCTCGGSGIDHVKDCIAWKYLPTWQERNKGLKRIKRYT